MGNQLSHTDRATPLVLLVGFLGSGKTTQLKYLIDEALAGGLQPSVILNDYGNADIDVIDLQRQNHTCYPLQVAAFAAVRSSSCCQLWPTLNTMSQACFSLKQTARRMGRHFC